MLKTAQDRGQKKKAKLVSSLQIRAFERRLKFSRSKYTKKYQGVGVLIIVLLHTIQHKIWTFQCNSDHLLEIVSLASLSHFFYKDIRHCWATDSTLFSPPSIHPVCRAQYSPSSHPVFNTKVKQNAVQNSTTLGVHLPKKI